MLKSYKSKLLTSDNVTSNHVTHGFYTRLGGVSNGIYAGLNLGLGSNDIHENVLENRKLLKAHMGGDKPQLQTLYQIHSADVVMLTEPWDIGKNPKADAMVTTKKNIILGILTADCVPVLFADHKNGVIGASHAGWKGALGGVIHNTITAMCELGADIQNISAVVGPAIAAESYEVGEEVRQAFTEKNARFADFFKKNPHDRYQFDLCGLVLWLLSQEKIESLEHIRQDTYQNQKEFYSFRRSTHKKEPDYGRQISAICLKD